MHLIQLPTDRGPQNFFILKPKDMRWDQVRALYYSTHSKEVMLQDRGKLEYENAEAKKRRPVGMETWEGTYDLDNLRQWYQILPHYGVVRLGGAGHHRYFPEALERLAEQIGEPKIAHLPVVATGGSASGGATASAANQFPDRFIASAPNLIGLAGWDTDNEAARKTPRLYVIGSEDTGGQHLKQMLEHDKTIRQRGDLWAHAPTWWGYHVWWRSDQIILPYFLRTIDLRLPDKPDYSKSVPLKNLREQDGWIGLHETWETNRPDAIPWKEAGEAQRRGDASWLPDEFTARMWQAYVSNWPKTVIHFPRMDGNEGFAFPMQKGHVHHFMPADQPWRLLASGPVGDDVEVTWYAGLKPLKVLKTYNGNPYTVQLEPLPEGLHMIHAITRIGDRTEISHAHPILFQKPQN